MNKILATSKTCGPCHMLKSRLEKSSISVNIKSMNDPENIAWFREKGIRSVPILIIEDDNGNELERISSVEDIFENLKNN
jgi:glutaredoxin